MSVGMALAPTPQLPRYRDRSLADLVPSLLGGLGVGAEEDRLGLGEATAACLLVVDGLGQEQLSAHAELAPTLAGALAEPLTAGFPSTTAASLSSIGTGLPPGEHGLVGYTMAVEGQDRAMNVLLWELYGHGPKVDLREVLVPERLQPTRTAFERAAGAGLAVTLVGPRQHAGSGMTRATLRGGRYRPAFGLGDLIAESLAGLALGGGRALVYAYHPDLDLIGHVRGTDSDAWRLQLSQVDTVVSALAQRLPAGSLLLVTGDHGMVNVGEQDRIDVDEVAGLMKGVRLIAGEPRARHVHVCDGARDDVLAAWRETLGDRFWVATREEAVLAGWFGPSVLQRVRAHIGDLVVASRGSEVLVQRAVDPLQAGLLGHHGALTPAEQLVPLALLRPAG